MIIKCVNKMENKKIMAIRIFVLIIMIQFVSATSITIDMDETYGTGNEVSFNYTFLSDVSQDIEYIASVVCPNAPNELIEILNISLIANIPITRTYVYMTSVDEDIEPQSCEAIVAMTSPEETSKKEYFQIATNPSFKFQTLICKDESCNNQSKIFVLNNNIYFRFESEVQDITIVSNLKYPDGNIESIELPSSIKLEQLGTYELEINSSKDGYKDVKQSVQFGVIEKSAEIHEGFLPAIKDEPKIEEEKSPVFVFVILGVLLFVIVGFILFKVVKKKYFC
jgi:hypothetical protein